ncbi:MAG TPA: hypothetical protein VMR65_03465 [Candidatus Sulfotelmatobacter sp.]|nr:hypothetical protein [Candidatus Sulfotelmatobacter sp.]
MSNAALFGFLSISAVSVFTFVSIAAWSDARRREREAFYKNETMRKLAESPSGGTAALELLREEARLQARRRQEGQRLGGLITLAVGIGTWAFLRSIEPGKPLYILGLIPILVGLVLVGYSYLLAPKIE